MKNKLAVTGFALMLCASQSWAGTTGNGWTKPAAPALSPTDQDMQQQSPQTWVLHGKKVSCDSKRGWRLSEYKSHCEHN